MFSPQVTTSPLVRSATAWRVPKATAASWVWAKAGETVASASAPAQTSDRIGVGMRVPPGSVFAPALSGRMQHRAVGDRSYDARKEIPTMTFARTCSLAALAVAIGGAAALAQGTAPAPQAPSAQAGPAPSAPGAPPRPSAPTRDPKTPGYVTATNAKELTGGAVPPVDAKATGNFVTGPEHPAAPEMTDQVNVPHGLVHTFMMDSTASTLYPGLARTPGTRPELDPTNPAKRIVQSGPAPY